MPNTLVSHEQVMREAWDIWKESCVLCGLDPVKAWREIQREALSQGKSMPSYFPEEILNV